MFGEFRKFINQGNVIQLAVAFIMGAGFSTVISSLVSDIIMPVISLITGGLDFSNWFFSLNGQRYPDLQTAKAAGAATLNYGVFINAIILFLIISFAMFMLVRAYEATQPKGAVNTKDCPFCLSTVPQGATRCPACTSELGAVATK